MDRDAWRSVYDSPQWRRLRTLVKLEQPQCAWHGCSKPTEDADHIVPLSEGGAAYDRANVQGLCRRHHGVKGKADRARRQAREKTKAAAPA